MNADAEMEKDEKTRQRIISHMNKDHQDSLTRYVQVFCKQPASVAESAQLEDFTLEHMIFTTKHSRHIMKLKPPMGSLGEARERAVQLDTDALTALGRSNITVDKYLLPRGFQLVVFSAVVLTALVFFPSWNLYPDSLFHDNILVYTPAFTRFLRFARPFVIAAIVGVHPIEAFWFERSRLYKYNVPRLGQLWWMWITSVLVEGVGASHRFDGIARAKQEAKRKLKH